MILNEHETAAIVEYAENEEHMLRRDTQRAVKARLKVVVSRIRELKAIRSKPGQPGWAGTECGLDLEQQKGLATILVMARARAHGKKHFVRLPRVMMLPPIVEGPEMVRLVPPRYVETQVELARLCDAQIAARFPGGGGDLAAGIAAAKAGLISPVPAEVLAPDLEQDS
jgi:hypothetical protein